MNAENSTMEIDQQNEDLNNWLPVTASREAKWWYSAFHNVTAMVGAGVLGLPFAISQLGWYTTLFVPKPYNLSPSFFFFHFFLNQTYVYVMCSLYVGHVVVGYME